MLQDISKKSTSQQNIFYKISIINKRHVEYYYSMWEQRLWEHHIRIFTHRSMIYQE